jgi:N-acyl-L-homoserine lactone synthetase
MESLTFRKARSVDELESLLRLRYQVFSESRLADYVHPTDDGIDLDAFDLKSAHFGLFGGREEEPVGYLRRVEGRRSEHASMIEEIVARHPGEHTQVLSDTGQPYPILSYHPDREAIRLVCLQAEMRGRKLAEVSRLSLHRGVRSLHTAVFMASSAIAAGFADGFEESVVILAVSHIRFYERFGFRITAGTSERFVHECSMICEHWKREWLPMGLEGEILGMADSYRARGALMMDQTHDTPRRLVA